VAVLVIDTEDLLPEAGDRVDGAARRIWVAQQQTERRKLERGGVPTATVDPAGGAGPAILALRRRMEAAQGRAAAGVWTRP